MESFLVWCRKLLWLPIIGSLLLTLGCGIVGILMIAKRTIYLFQQNEFSPKVAKKVAIVTVETLDLFLIATMAYLTAYGLYKLFVASREFEGPIRIKIPDLTTLKNKIVGVVIAALGVTFFGKVAQEEISTDVMYEGIGFAAVIIALAFVINYGKSKTVSK